VVAAISIAQLAGERCDRACAESAQNIQMESGSSAVSGSHGQTVFIGRQGQGENRRLLGYTNRAGGAVIAQILVFLLWLIFRAADIAAGGQGARLLCQK